MDFGWFGIFSHHERAYLIPGPLSVWLVTGLLVEQIFNKPFEAESYASFCAPHHGARLDFSKVILVMCARRVPETRQTSKPTRRKKNVKLSRNVFLEI